MSEKYDWRQFDGPQFFTRVPLEEKVVKNDINLHTELPLSVLAVKPKTFFLNEKHTSTEEELSVMGRVNQYIEKLKAGETVKYRPHGNSMVPKIHSGELCTLAPIGETPPEVGEAVLCSVHGRQFLHLVTAVKDGRYQISNNKGHVNGWIGLAQVYGRLIQVDP